MPWWKFLSLIIAASMSSCSMDATHSLPQRSPAVQVDHVIVGISNLEAGIGELERITGVRAVRGGVHPGGGTQNALLSLGPGVYLELYAPDPAQDVQSATVAKLKGLRRLTPIGWAVSTADVEVLRSYLSSVGFPQSTPEPGSRVRADGSVLEWVTFGYEQVDHSLAPFFIHWKHPETHPSRTSPSGCRLVSIRLSDLAPDQLRAAVQPLGLSIHVGRSAEKQMQVRLSCPRGTVALG